MTVPSNPYCTSQQVAYLLVSTRGGGIDFDGSSTPTQPVVNQHISWICSHLEMRFQQAGYVLPFTVISGESWPSHQTNYLQLVSAMGAAAFSMGHVLKPAPALSPGRGESSGNIFQKLYDQELDKIWNGRASFIRFRASTYAGSPAEYSIKEPTGPSLDYMVGKKNPEDELRFWDYTILKHNIEMYVSQQTAFYSPIDWQDFHGLFSTKLSGYSYQSID